MLPLKSTRLLHRSLRDAFTRDQFQQVLTSRIGLSLDRLVAPTASADVWAFEVVQLAERAGWTTDLVRAAFEARPQHADLATVYRDLGLATPISIQSSGAEVPLDDRDLPEIPDGPFVDIARWHGRLFRVEVEVCRVEVGGRGVGSGFLVGPDVVLTSYHHLESILAGEVPPRSLRLRFDYRALPDGVGEGILVGPHPSDWLVDACPYSKLDLLDEPGELCPSDDELDYALIRLERPIGSEPLPPAVSSGPPRGWIVVPETAPVLEPGLSIAIVQYAKGGPLTVAVDTNAVLELNRAGNRVKYTTATAPGSGGAPCFDASWRLIAIHQGRDSRDLDAPRFRQGIPIAAIRERIARVGKLDHLGGDPPETI